MFLATSLSRGEFHTCHLVVGNITQVLHVFSGFFLCFVFFGCWVPCPRKFSGFRWITHSHHYGEHIFRMSVFCFQDVRVPWSFWHHGVRLASKECDRRQGASSEGVPGELCCRVKAEIS